MSNTEILTTDFMLHGLEFDKQKFDTFAGWKRRNKKIKKGSKAVLKTKIWKPSKYKNEDGEEKKGMFLVNASYFSIEQTESIKQ